MSMFKVSIIIPVYNGSKHIERCLASVIGQTYLDIEIIIVDDGSSDDSLDICTKLQNDDSRIRVYSQENMGVSSARNSGIDKATGMYITFVDIDDWLENDAIETMISLMADNGVDCVRTHYFVNDINGKRSIPRTGLVQGLAHGKSISNVLNDLLLAKDNCYVVLLLVKKDLLDKYNIRFSTEFDMMEDVVFYCLLFSRINKLYISNQCTYNYSWNPNSASKSVDKLIYNAKSTIEVSNYLDKRIAKYRSHGFDMAAIHATHLSIIASRIITATTKSRLLTLPNVTKYVDSVCNMVGFIDLVEKSNLEYLKFYQKYTVKFLSNKRAVMYFLILRSRVFADRLRELLKKIHGRTISIQTRGRG